ncbi:hypothetical protein SRHO_G00248140 [Serrasalmus rhombeus]
MFSSENRGKNREPKLPSCNSVSSRDSMCGNRGARDPKISSRRQTHERPRLARGEEGEGGGASCSVFSHKPRDPEEVPLGWVTWSSPNEEERLRLALGLQHFYFSINTFSASRNETAAFCFTRLERGRGGTHEDHRRPSHVACFVRQYGLKKKEEAEAEAQAAMDAASEGSLTRPKKAVPSGCGDDDEEEESIMDTVMKYLPGPLQDMLKK